MHIHCRKVSEVDEVVLYGGLYNIGHLLGIKICESLPHINRITTDKLVFKHVALLELSITKIDLL